MTFDINSTLTMPSEGLLPDLSELAEEASQGAWPAGWYKATIIEGYASRKGTQFLSQDTLSSRGDSRNLRLCFTVTNAKGDTRNIQGSYNYRITDFAPEVLTAVKGARAEFKGMNKWPSSASDLQRSSLAIAKLGALQKAVGFRLNWTGASLDPSPFFDQAIDVRLGVDEKGYNEVKEFAKAGTPHTGGLK